MRVSVFTPVQYSWLPCCSKTPLTAFKISQHKSNLLYKTVTDRRAAIQYALSIAHNQDIVLIAGKGHEDYQILKDKTVHFDDREEVRKALRG